MLKRPFSGHFITLEGGEGAGKSSLLHELEYRLVQLGYCVLVTREPGGSSLGETLRQWLLEAKGHAISDQTELLLFLAARSQHICEKIRPALEAGQIVLCDRFNDSTIAYQGGARGLGIDYVTQLCTLICGNVQPQLTLLLQVSPEIGLARSKALDKQQAQAGELDRIEAESLAFHQSIQYTFDALAQREPQRMIKINADQSREAVKVEALQVLDHYFSSYK